MKAIKKLNNNVVVCLDSNGKQLIAMGKGIGFPAIPYDITDLSTIKKTFYELDSKYFGLFSEVPSEIFEVASDIVENAKNVLKVPLNPNLVASLADHIDFAIKRQEKYKNMKMLFSYEIENLYPVETKLGRWALKQIKKKLNIYLPESEVTSIALHFIDAKESFEDTRDLQFDSQEMIDQVVQKVENYYDTTIDKSSFSYNRFVSHIQYLLIRLDKDEQFIQDEGLFKLIKEQYPTIYDGAMLISDYIGETTGKKMTENETLYMMIHLQRILQKDSQ